MTKHPYELFEAALGDETATQEFRKLVAPRTIFTDERAHLAVAIARKYSAADNLELAEVWALRALHDGPSVDAFALLGDIAQDTGDLTNARSWYEQAIACTVVRRHEDPDTRLRAPARLRAIQRELREDWRARAPIRDLGEGADYPVAADWQGAVALAAARGVPVVYDPAGTIGAFARRRVLDADLAFLAWAPELKLPHERDVFDSVWVLPVVGVPAWGTVVTLAPSAARMLASRPGHDPSVLRSLTDRNYGAFSGNLPAVAA